MQSPFYFERAFYTDRGLSLDNTLSMRVSDIVLPCYQQFTNRRSKHLVILSILIFLGRILGAKNTLLIAQI